MAAEALEREWDIFISYAREDSDWVKQHLYEPLLSCRTTSAARPVVFLDVSKEGIPSGTNFLDFIGEAMQRSRHIVAVYSESYFRKPMCDLELKLAFELHIKKRSRLHPVLIEGEAVAQVPFVVSQHNWYPVDLADWFERLCADLELTVETTPPLLRFRGDVGDVLVNHTLPAVRVAIVDAESDAVLPSADPVTISADGAELQGTLVVSAEDGVATFRDLSFSSAAAEVRLVAEAPGCEPAVGAAFPVKQPAPAQADGKPAQIQARGLPVFFPDGRTLAVLGDEVLGLFGADGARIAELPFPGPLRLWARGESCLAFADWSGRLALLHPSGRFHSFDLTGGARALSVPGSICFAADRAFVGMWSGTVWAVSLDDPEPQRQFEHPPGVQALGVTDDRWVVGGLDGTLTVHSPGSPSEVHTLEPLLLGIRASSECVVAVGEERVHRLSLQTSGILQQELPVNRVASALLDGELAVAVAADGRGVRFDSELNIRGGFHAARGAVPVAVSSRATSVVFAYPDGSHVLMVNDRVVFSSSSGPLAVSPDGLHVAFNDGGAIRTAPLDELNPDALETPAVR